MHCQLEKKIVHFLPWYSIKNKGGTEIFILDLAKRQKQQGQNVCVLSPGKFESEYFNSIFLLDSIGVFYFVLCEYGINATSSRDIAANKEDLDSVKKIINKSFSTKFILNIFFFSVFFSIVNLFVRSASIPSFS